MRIKVFNLRAVSVCALTVSFFAAGTALADRSNNSAFANHANDMMRNERGVTKVERSLMPERKKGGLIFGRASDVPAAEQLAKAKTMEAAGDWSDACDAYDTLVRSYPESAEAAYAQFREARLYEKLGEYDDAFEEYFYTLCYYPVYAPVDEILQQMYAIANYYRSENKTSKSIKYFDLIAKSFPKWRYTPQTLVQLGLLYFDDKEYYKAAEAFDTVTANHPGTPEAGVAAEQHAFVLYALSQKYPEDESLLIRATSLTQTALRNGNAKSANQQKLAANLKDLTFRRSEKYYKIAKFYDCSRFKSETKISAYKDFLRRFPASDHSEAAKKRIAELESGE